MGIPHCKIVIVGFGSIGRGIIPLLQSTFSGSEIWIVEQSLNADQQCLIARHGLHLVQATVSPANYQDLLAPLLGAGDFLLNLAISVCSKDLILLAQAQGAFYVDSCIDPWQYQPGATGIETSNYHLREDILALRRASEGRPTAIVAQGANPGFVSILVKRALLEMAARAGLAGPAPRQAGEWAALARDLEVRVIQISERDTQVTSTARASGEFACTWSVDGFVTECLQPVEMGWGTHERTLPPRGRRHAQGSGAAIVIDQPCYTTKVKSWSPNFLDFEAWLITHNEAISIADYLTCRADNQVSYRPTCYYAYYPCDDAVDSLALLAGGNAKAIHSTRILMDEITSGIDELGVFVISARHPALWLGSNLSIGKARKMAPYNNATSLQVVSSVVAGMAWAVENPRRGVVESDDLDQEFIYQRVEPYWAPIVCVSLPWWPLRRKSDLQVADFLLPT